MRLLPSIQQRGEAAGRGDASDNYFLCCPKGAGLRVRSDSALDNFCRSGASAAEPQAGAVQRMRRGGGALNAGGGKRVDRLNLHLSGPGSLFKCGTRESHADPLTAVVCSAAARRRPPLKFCARPCRPPLLAHCSIHSQNWGQRALGREQGRAFETCGGQGAAHVPD